ncbi:MAG: hypothetical protein Q4D86_02510 [Pasteurella oralis]|uniref:ApeI family dehydratase n=1 Tax=Pasteurella oralis TaxID=1071947 RepID=UPI001179FD3C|nr:hypothetical protein [Pasteurella oralis]MDO5054170.1 hypothetical protein [Pasteurella oralis]
MNSIQQIKQLLQQHSWVNDCIIRIQQDQLWALVELSTSGISVFREQGRKSVVNQLCSDFESVAIPWVWRFVEKLPQQQDFDVFIDSFSPILTPSWTNYTSQDNVYLLSGKVPLDLHYFEGHFAHFPLVPGVIELQWVNEQITRLFDFKRNILRIDNLKFQKFLRPNDEMLLTLKWEATKNRIAFQLKTEGEMCASGLIVFADE